MVGVVLLTLTFDSSPIKGEGYMVGVVLLTRATLPPCGYCLKASMTVPGTTHPSCGFPPTRE